MNHLQLHFKIVCSIKNTLLAEKTILKNALDKLRESQCPLSN